jgi:hypothetical protein
VASPADNTCTCNPTPLDGSAKEAISVSANSVACRMTSSPSKMRYCVMFLLSKFVMLFWANLIYGNIMLYMSLGLVVVIITLNRKLYRIPEAVPPSVISLISAKKCRKVISQTKKFVFFMILSQSERKIAATSRAFAVDLSTQQKQVDKVVAEYKYIFSSPIGVPLHCQVMLALGYGRL